MHSWFETKEYIEVHTPCLVSLPGTEVHLQYFELKQSVGSSVFLRSSPEIQMKRLLKANVEAIYELAPSFRKGDFGAWHSPEFLMLEWYKKGLSFKGMMDETIELICHLSHELQKVVPNCPCWQMSDFKILTVGEAFMKYANLELIDGDPDLQKKAVRSGVLSCIEGAPDFETNFFKIMLEKIEPALKALKLCVLKDFPASMAILSEVEGPIAKRFEIYINGIELCNAFLEELDPSLNRARIQAALKERKELNYPLMALPLEFLEDLTELAKQEIVVSGNALGIERLLAILLGSDLSQVQAFYSKD